MFAKFLRNSCARSTAAKTRPAVHDRNSDDANAGSSNAISDFGDHAKGRPPPDSAVDLSLMAGFASSACPAAVAGRCAMHHEFAGKLKSRRSSALATSGPPPSWANAPNPRGAARTPTWMPIAPARPSHRCRDPRRLVRRARSRPSQPNPPAFSGPLTTSTTRSFLNNSTRVIESLTNLWQRRRDHLVIRE